MVVEREEERVESEPVVERHTTVVSTGADRGGGGGTLLAVVLLIAALIVLFLLFGRGLIGGADDLNVNVDVKAPDIELPQSDPPAKPAQ
jgi:hypothetical protein